MRGASVVATTPSGTRRLAVCADDFGQAPATSAAIVELARAGRLTATTCIVTGPHWPEAARSLAGAPPSFEVGLHLNLSDGAPASAALRARWPTLPSLGRLLLASHLGRLPRDAIRAEIDAQLDAFGTALGRPPDFVDGHQHVHHLPGIRPILLDRLAAFDPPPAVRATAPLLGPGFGFKRRVIEATGGRALAGELRERGIAHNPALVGAYDFGAGAYRDRMRGWLAALPADGGLLFCHPGAGDPARPDPHDPIGAARVRERAYFASDGFVEDLHEARVELGSVWSHE